MLGIPNRMPTTLNSLAVISSLISLMKLKVFDEIERASSQLSTLAPLPNMAA
jgi:hypothetical protein